MENINEEKIEDILSDEIDLEDSDSTEESNSESSDAVYYLSSGEALNTKETYEITAREKTKLVVLAGLAGSGKTTIETSLYQMFQKQSMGGVYFAGSNTIQGYEQRAFFTRTKSRGTTPTTQRTSLEIGRSFLHLRLWERETDEFCNLLFADLSGEAFETHIGRVDEVKQDFPFMDRADYFVGVLDGELINNKRKRNGAVAAMIELVRTFYDAELVGRGCVLQQLFKTLKPELCNKKEQESLARFLIPICLIDDFMVDTEIVRFAYIQVNRLLATQSFPEYEWEKLEELLPEVAWYNNWDRCKRLRKGLKKKGYQIKELKEKEELPKYLL